MTWAFILFITGFVTGAVDAVAGGGGLISLPVLLISGMPPHIALGTNKLQNAAGTASAVLSYYRAGLLNFNTIYKGLMFGFLGAVLGAIASQLLRGDLLNKILPILLFIVLIYTLFSPRSSYEDHPPRLQEMHFYALFGFTLGFYDGFFGPGTGAFWVFSLTFFLGYNLRKATAYTKVFNLKSNLIAAVCFAFGASINYHTALIMGIGQMIGARIGAHFTIRKGAAIIRPLLIIMVSTTMLVECYKHYLA